ncbi:ABC transporter substrate-binding protein [Paenibacillus senegalensis]|uniref:ABC transporter substrate-binding protein n=1 Tax=Paenibacillus senegalensis TaxID=1465766 RepID=UPI000287D936|nr:ABC transporter substrate-binding protein [Paenibacillus senegalensis]
MSHTVSGKLLTAVLSIMLLLIAAACGNGQSGSTGGPSPAQSGGNEANQANQEGGNPSGKGAEGGSEPSSEGDNGTPAGEQTITYLGQEYTLPDPVEKIVITGAMEAMEDALVLDVKPVGAITFAGQFPELFAPIVTDAESIGEKSQPNFETILKLKPDVILASTKFPDDVVEQLEKIATTIRVSHIATHWEDNLRLMGELSGKTEQAEQEIANYQAALEQVKPELTEKLQDKTVLFIRIRAGQMFIYPETVFFNPILYNDLGLTAPAEVKAAQTQEQISVEALAGLNPDIIFIQNADVENADNTAVLEELQNNPIIKSVEAVKNDKVYVNVIDPLAEGGPAWSRITFLKEAIQHLTE